MTSIYMPPHISSITIKEIMAAPDTTPIPTRESFQRLAIDQLAHVAGCGGIMTDDIRVTVMIYVARFPEEIRELYITKLEDVQAQWKEHIKNNFW